MDVLVSLLRSKNRCLERILETSRGFLDATTPGGEAGANTDADRIATLLRELELRREAIVKAFQLYDRKINEAVLDLPASARTPALIESVRSGTERSEALLRDLVEVDHAILARIDATRAELTREIQQTQKSKAAVGKFKSSWVPQSGERLDEKL